MRREHPTTGRSRCSIKMRWLSTHSRLALVLVSPVLVSCAAVAPPVDSAPARPPEGPCELDGESLRRIGQLDADFQHSRQVPETEPTIADDYGYEFDDDPLGATVEDGSCDCLARAVSDGREHTCVGALRAA